MQQSAIITTTRTMAALLLPLLLTLTLSATMCQGLDFSKLQPIADRNIHTGNKMLIERALTANETATAASTSDYLDVNEIPVRFDEMQLWRIYNISAAMRSAVPDTLEHKFGGVIWKENSKFLDISIAKQHLKGARSYLTSQHLQTHILNANVQDLIDEEERDGMQHRAKRAGGRARRATRSDMDWKEYHDIDVIYSFMREIREKFPNICRLYTIGKTAEGRDLKVLRISENPKEYSKIWIDGGIHAREWISPATVTFILYQLMSKWTEQPAYLKEKTWYFMPVMNPDGYMFSRKSNRMWRKNRAPSKRSNCIGVDLNRNFDIGWSGFGSSTNPCKDTYRGIQPASELETKAVAEFLGKRKNNLQAYLTFHSYGQVFVYPWAYKAVKVKDAADLLSAAKTAVQRIKDETNSIYRTGSTYEMIGIAGGGSDDWSRAALGTKYVYTVELRDRGNHGFILPPRQIIGTGTEGYIFVETIAQAIK